MGRAFFKNFLKKITPFKPSTVLLYGKNQQGIGSVIFKKDQKIFWQERKHPYLCNPLLKKGTSSSKKFLSNLVVARLSAISRWCKPSKEILKKIEEKFGRKIKGLTFALPIKKRVQK